MKKFFVSGWYMINDIKGSLKGVLDNLPYIMALGIIMGTGAYATVFGALIISAANLFTRNKKTLIYSATAVLCAVLSAIVVIFKGNLEHLWAVLFIAGIITGVIGCFIPKKTILSIPKSISSGFMTGCLICILILCFPLIMGQSTYATFPLMVISKYNPFSYVNENALICSITVFVVYHYLTKTNMKFIPKSIISVIIPSIINLLFNMNLILSTDRIEFFTPVAKGDFGKTVYVILFGLLVSTVMVVQTLSNLKALGIRNKMKKPVLLIEGISNTLGAMTGTIAGVVSYAPSKEAVQNKSKNNISEFIIVFILLICSIFFKNTIGLIPVCAVSAILFIKLYETIKYNLHSQKIKNINSKIIFWICLISTVINIIFGLAVSIVLTFIITVKNKKPKIQIAI